VATVKKNNARISIFNINPLVFILGIVTLVFQKQLDVR
jgi:hypothetical protein